MTTLYADEIHDKPIFVAAVSLVTIRSGSPRPYARSER
jgi:hypothetical protein